MKKYLISTATTSKIENNIISNIYTEEEIKNSDYEQSIKGMKKAQSKTITEYIESYSLYPIKNEIEWITTITRLS